MYNYRIPNRVVRQAVDYSTGAVQLHKTGTTMDDLKAFMDKETMGIKNKFLIGGAVVLGVGYYGYTKGWF